MSEAKWPESRRKQVGFVLAWLVLGLMTYISFVRGGNFGGWDWLFLWVPTLLGAVGVLYFADQK